MRELPDPDTWRGELYLELHRATFTTQHHTKQGNRRNQRLLAEAELWASVAAVRAGFGYPYEELDEIWREVLLLQFHDILPGTSIAWVHREAEEAHARLTVRLEVIIGQALTALGVTLTDRGELLVNAAPVARLGIPACSVAPSDAPAGVTASAEADGFVLESDQVRAVIDRAGLVVSLVDRRSGREAIAEGGRGNLLQLHQDFPNAWDAWDVDSHYRDMREDLDGPADVRLDGDAVVVRRSFGASSVTQRLTLDPAGRILTIDCDIDWHEDEKFLKLAFPVDAFSDEVLAETQFGYQRRANHTNTSWEAARFETHAQHWFLVREPGFGVAFLNESSHGFDVTRVHEGGRVTNLARFSVLRAPRFPDPQADRGRHHLRFGVLVGADIPDATGAGWAFEHPGRTAEGATVAPLVVSSGPGVVVCAVKLADDRSGDLIVRVYESLGARGATTLSFDLPGIASVARTDLIERTAPGDLPLDDGSVELTLRPFEVVTLRVRR
ncbi:alpha-mannosidase [Tessaracoccus coleopterorum]|uniref:alpha-mannosidase n=1 Tax=Tessaracoccus coleopterorum TaxID=2714950 RepID=UPI001E47914F|nr:glycoside hydrolase family 38 C-terminal domain-containing protein [Tessaracoccus coleopterorum]